MQEVSIKTCQRRKTIKKKKYPIERYHMNTDINERLKQYQRNYYASKKLKNNLFLQYKNL